MITVSRGVAAGQTITAALARPDDFAGWRDHARRLIGLAIAPDRVLWQVSGESDTDLFGEQGLPLPSQLGDPPADSPPLRVSKTFLDLAATAALHSDPRRFALLYRLLWRLQTARGLLSDGTDSDVQRLHALARAVRRDIHKMRAFVRFRAIGAGAQERYVAWFEPAHHILHANAAFFVNRFTAMHWSILTPQGSLHWDGEMLHEGLSATRADAPPPDSAEDLWKGYYASIFNPARLKVRAMLKEMPRRYWQNMPETALIPGLIAGAQARETAMVAQGAPQFSERRPDDLAEIAAGIGACTRCPIGCNGTRAVAGEGRPDAALFIIGEQPGDCEERAGRPFVGPAGQILRTQAATAGIDLRQAWTTNAVKHFKFVEQGPGKRRLHNTPSAREIDICRWWVESERMVVKPRIVLALGASAARSVLGKTVSVQQMRGSPQQLADGSELWITTHPSYLLRLADSGRDEESARFAADLRRVAERLDRL